MLEALTSCFAVTVYVHIWTHGMNRQFVGESILSCSQIMGASHGGGGVGGGRRQIQSTPLLFQTSLPASNGGPGGGDIKTIQAQQENPKHSTHSRGPKIKQSKDIHREKVQAKKPPNGQGFPSQIGKERQPPNMVRGNWRFSRGARSIPRLPHDTRGSLQIRI